MQVAEASRAQKLFPRCSKSLTANTASTSYVWYRQLRLERCDGFTTCQLRSRSLQQVSLADCKQLQTLCLLCPALQTINLEECNCLQQVCSDVSALPYSALPCPALPCLALPTIDLEECNISYRYAPRNAPCHASTIKSERVQIPAANTLLMSLPDLPCPAPPCPALSSPALPCTALQAIVDRV